MAVTKEQLAIEITVQNKETTNQIDSLKNSIKELTLAEKQALENMQLVNNNFKKSNEILTQQISLVDQITKGYNDYKLTAIGLISALTIINIKTSESFKNIEKNLYSTISSMKLFLSSSIIFFNDLKNNLIIFKNVSIDTFKTINDAIDSDIFNIRKSLEFKNILDFLNKNFIKLSLAIQQITFSSFITSIKLSTTAIKDFILNSQLLRASLVMALPAPLDVMLLSKLPKTLVDASKAFEEIRSIKYIGKDLEILIKNLGIFSTMMETTINTIYNSSKILVTSLKEAFKINPTDIRSSMILVTESFKSFFGSLFPLLKSDMQNILTIIKNLFIDIFRLINTSFLTIIKGANFNQLAKELSLFQTTIANIFTAKESQDIFKFLKLSLKDLKNNISIFIKEIPNLFKTIQQSSIKNLQIFDKINSTIKDILKGSMDIGKVFLKEHASSSLIVFSEAASLANASLVGLGAALLSTDNAFFKLMGTISLVAGVLLGGFAFAIELAMSYIGGLLEKIGDKLLVMMDEYETKFKKAEVATRNFAFTMVGFNKEFGTSIGTIETWNAILEELSKVTIFSQLELSKMVQEIVQVGSILGLTQKDMENLARTIPNFVSAEGDLYEATISFMQALGGNSQGLIKYGLHINENSINHSEFAKKLNISTSQLTDQQLALARLNVIFEQSKPIIGKANEQIYTMAGSIRYINNNLDLLKIKLGESGTITKTFYELIAKLSDVLRYVPNDVINVTSTLLDFISIAAKVLGIVMSMSFSIAASSAAWELLKIAIEKNNIVIQILNTSLIYIGKALSFNAIPIKKLTDLFLNMALIIKSIVITSLVVLQNVIKSSIANMILFSKVILSNPLFWKALIIASSLFLVYKSMQKINEQIEFTSDLQKVASISINYFIESFKDLQNALDLTEEKFILAFKVITDVIITSIYSIMAGFQAIITALVGVTKGFADLFNIDMPNVSAYYEASVEKLNLYNEKTTKSIENLFTFSQAAKAASNSTNDFNSSINDTNKIFDNLKNNLITSTEKAKIFAEVLGRPTEKLMLSQSFAEESLANAKTIEDKKKYAQELVKIDAEIIKAYNDASKLANDKREEIALAGLEQIKTESNITKAFMMRLKADLKPYIEALNDLTFLPTTSKTLKAFEQLNATIKAITEKNNQDLLNAQIEYAINVNSNNLDLAIEYAQIKGYETEIIKLEAEKQTAIAQEQFRKREIDAKQLAQKLKNINLKESKSLEDEYKKRTDEYKAAQAEVFDIIATESEKRQKAYDDRLDGLKKNLQKELIEEGQYAVAVAKLRKEKEKLDKEEINTKKWEKVASIVNSIKSGPGEVASNIASRFGVIGQIIGGILNALGQTQESFKTWINDLQLYFNKWPNMVLKNIPVLVETIISNLPDAIAEVLRFNFLQLDLTRTIVKAFINGVKKAIPEMKKLMKDLFSGNFDWFGDELKTTIEDVFSSKVLSGVSEQLFGLKNIGEKAANFADEIGKSIYDSTKEAADILEKTWKRIAENIKTLFEKIGIDLGLNWETAGLAFVDQLTMGIISSTAFIVSALEAVFPKITKEFTDNINKLFADIGVKLGLNWQTVGLLIADAITGGLISSVTASMAILKKPFEDMGLELGFNAKTAGMAILDTLSVGVISSTAAIWTGIQKLLPDFKNDLENVFQSIGLDFKDKWKVVGFVIADAVLGGLISGSSVILAAFKSDFKQIGDDAKKAFEDIGIKVQSWGQWLGLGVMDSLTGGIISLVAILNKLFDWLSANLSIGGTGAGGALSTGILSVLTGGISTIFQDNASILDIGASILTGGVSSILGSFFAKGGVVKPLYAQNGLFVPRGSDTVPAMLTPGEFVLNRAAVKNLGLGNVLAMNNGKSVGSPQNFNISLQIKTEQPIDENFVKTKMMPIIKNELKRASIDGKRVLSPTGVR